MNDEALKRIEEGVSKNSSHIRYINQRVVLCLPLLGVYWKNFLLKGGQRLFVAYAVSNEKLLSKSVLLRKKDPIHGQKANLIVSMMIGNMITGRISQAFISLVPANILIKDSGWIIDIQGIILKRLAEILNALEKTDVKKWHFDRYSRDHIMLLFPSILTQHDVVEGIRKCVEIYEDPNA